MSATPKRTLYREAARLKKAEHPELLAALERIHDELSGWADRLAATPGADAAFTQRHLDAASARVGEAEGVVRHILMKEPR